MLDCVGDIISCTHSGFTGTITVNDGGASVEDSVTVNSTAVDTTANFLDGDIDFTLADGGAGGPDNITATLNCVDCINADEIADVYLFNTGDQMDGDYFITNANGLVIGHTAKEDFGAIPEFQILGTGAPDSSFALGRWSNNAGGPTYRYLKSRGTSIGSNVIVQDGDELGRIRFQAADGFDFNTNAAEISAEVCGTPGANDMPGCILFSTTNDGSSSVTEKMRITDTGAFLIGGTTEATADIFFGANGATVFNEQGNDADLRMESDNQTHTFFLDASTDRIGMNVPSPAVFLDVKSDDEADFSASASAPDADDVLLITGGQGSNSTFDGDGSSGGDGGSIDIVGGVGGTAGSANTSGAAEEIFSGRGGHINLTTGAGGAALDPAGCCNYPKSSGDMGFRIGVGGAATGVAAGGGENIAGNGGSLQFLGGNGGVASGNSGDNTGGDGTSMTFTGGNGGAATGSAGNEVGGIGGFVTFTAGRAGNGIDTQGTAGFVNFRTSKDNTSSPSNRIYLLDDHVIINPDTSPAGEAVGSLHVHSLVAGTQVGIFQGFTSQTAPLLETQDVSANSLWFIDETGAEVSGVSTTTVADSGDGNPVAFTITPTTSHLEITCSDSDTCDATMSETGARNGQEVKIINAGTNVVDISDTSGVSETAGAFAMGQYDVITMVYISDRWVEQNRSNN